MRRRAICIAAALASLAGAPAHAGVQSAAYGEPTTRYAHGVLGDAIEYGALEVTLTDGRQITLRLPQERVFEDIAPRLADVDGDGDAEIIVVESAQTAGARLAIYDETGLVAATPYIGRTNRWLAPLGAADLDGDGHIELAYIDRPHLAKTLRIWRFSQGALRPVADQPGLTNHRIGEDFISGGIVSCDGVPTIVTANANWSRIMQSVLKGGRVQTTDAGAFTPDGLAAASKDCP